MKKQLTSANKTGLLLALAICGTMILGYSIFPSPAERNRPVSDSAPRPAPAPDVIKQTVEKRYAFAAKEAEFVKLPAKVQLTREPYLKGKAAFYFRDVETGKKDKYWILDNKLNETLASGYETKIKDVTAQTPDEVETVVLGQCRQLRKGELVVPGKIIPRYIWRCEVTIVDRTIGAVIHRKTFESRLEKEAPVNNDADKIEAPVPYSEIYGFLGGLPRR
jgi:hypothetical protein